MADIWSAIKSAFPEEGERCKPGCGQCCQAGTYVEKAEALEISEWICRNIPVEALREQFGHADTQPDMCPFLTPDRKCFIYPARPVVCHFYGHLKDAPYQPVWCSQQCPEKIPFTLIDVETYLPIIEPWYEAAVKAYCRIGDFRRADLIGSDGRKIAI
jgi:Fe-S-cluster containining protein